MRGAHYDAGSGIDRNLVVSGGMRVSVVAQERFGPVVEVDGRWFYVSLAAFSTLFAIVGFAPTYWLPLAAGTLDLPRVLHVHGALLFSWPVFFLLQATWVASGRTLRHRRLGLLGSALAIAVTVSGVMAAAHALNTGIATGDAHEARAFAIAPLSAIAFFAAVVAVAIANVRRPAVHKRLMVLATFSILQPAAARWVLVLLAPADAVGPPPVLITLIPALVVDSLLLAAIAYDWRRHGRLHPAYLYGMIALVSVQLLRIPFSESAGWHTLSGWFAVAMS
jgi:hypothetical protein